MRKNTIITLLFICFATGAFASCDSVNLENPDWCAECESTFNDAVCGGCEDVNFYPNPAGTACISIDCTSAMSGVVTNEICNQCSTTNIYANHDGSSCTTYNCNIEPSPITSAYCMACDGTNNYTNNDDSACTSLDCSEPPTPLTDTYCSVCETILTVANDAGSQCVAPPVNCSATPLSGSFTNAWCNKCASGVNSKDDATACATSSNSTKLGAFLSIISSILIFLAII